MNLYDPDLLKFIEEMGDGDTRRAAARLRDESEARCTLAILEAQKRNAPREVPLGAGNFRLIAEIPDHLFHRWGDQEGYEFWDEELKDYLRDNPGVACRPVSGRVVITNRWGGVEPMPTEDEHENERRAS